MKGTETCGQAVLREFRCHEVRDVREVTHMQKKEKGVRIAVLPLVIFLSVAGVLVLLSQEGGSSMGKKVNAGVHAKPPIDMNVPLRVETATFAMG